ncbi:MAG TPA: hypothetical protein EYG11_22115 [Candidatus Latescibacteria bacterium]|nr:hypothetical protein [Candidatus Handelsmanbacteria bacterium]HIL11395.1 hypothetical protein [Candidatus Latescibacterota bacterium]
MAELAEGRPFAELLEPFAPNDAIAEGDGVVGWFNYADAERRFLIPRRVFFALALDQVAEPVRLPRGWQIFRFLDERTPDLQDYYQEVRRLVQQRQWQAGNREDILFGNARFDEQRRRHVGQWPVKGHVKRSRVIFHRLFDNQPRSRRVDRRRFVRYGARRTVLDAHSSSKSIRRRRFTVSSWLA